MSCSELRLLGKCDLKALNIYNFVPRTAATLSLSNLYSSKFRTNA